MMKDMHMCQSENNFIYGLIDPRSEELRYVGFSSRGMKFTQEQKDRLSIAHMGYRPCDSARENMRKAQQARRLREIGG